MTRLSSLILIVEDDPAMLRFIRRTLELNDLAVVTAVDGPSALRAVQLEKPDLILMDLGIPGIDGLDLCRRVKAEHQVPIIMVTARGEDEDVVMGFEVGAEDYLAKPFSSRVLVARVNALLRRTQPWAASDTIMCGDLEMDMAARRVTWEGQRIHLTPTEYKLLSVLARHPNRVLTTEQISSQIWGQPYDGDPQILRTHIGRLRRKLQPVRSGLSLIRTEPGVGYWLQCAPDPPG